MGLVGCAGVVVWLGEWGWVGGEGGGFLLDPDRDYWKVPFGKPAWISYGVVTVAFMLVHQPVDYLGALIFGSIMYWVAVSTKSLMACIVMHGVANLLMGLYALHYGKYGLW